MQKCQALLTSLLLALAVASQYPPVDNNAANDVPNVNLPGWCPQLITPSSPQYATLKASFNSFVEYAAITASRSTDPCPRPDSITLGVSFNVHTERALQANLPNGAQIISIALEISNGFFFQKIIYLFNGAYFYVMYNTGCRAFRRLQIIPETEDVAITPKAGPDQALNVYSIVTQLVSTPLVEGLISTSLEQLYNCVPGIENFELVKCQITMATFGNFFVVAKPSVAA